MKLRRDLKYLIQYLSILIRYISICHIKSKLFEISYRSSTRCPRRINYISLRYIELCLKFLSYSSKYRFWVSKKKIYLTDNFCTLPYGSKEFQVPITNKVRRIKWLFFSKVAWQIKYRITRRLGTKKSRSYLFLRRELSLRGRRGRKLDRSDKRQREQKGKRMRRKRGLSRVPISGERCVFARLEGSRRLAGSKQLNKEPKGLKALGGESCW